MEINFEKNPSDPLRDYQYEARSKSYLSLNPGDLISFSYSGSSRLGLVVSSRRASRGLFLSSRNKRLLNVVEVSSLTEAMFSLMVNNLYKNRTACNYHSPKIIGAFLGDGNFKTFDTAKINRIVGYDIV